MEDAYQNKVNYSLYFLIRHAPKPRHCGFASPEGKVGIFRSVVFVKTDLLAAFISNLFYGGFIRWATVSHDDLWIPVAFHCFFDNFNAADLFRLFVT